MADFEVKDSGERVAFEGGMVRDTTEGQIDYTLVLDGPMFKRWAVHLTKGAVKYTREFPLTLAFFCDVVRTCTCQKNVLIPVIPGISTGSVEAVMKKAYDNAIQNSLNVSVKILENGQTVIELENGMLTQIIKNLGGIERNFLGVGASLPQTSQKNVKSVAVKQDNVHLDWITTTKQDFLEAFCASNVISASVTSKTISSYLAGHKNTCEILPYKVKGNNIILPGKRNWMKAREQEELDRFKESALRHFLQWYDGDTDEDHAAATIFNMNGAEYVKEQIPYITKAPNNPLLGKNSG